MIRPQIGRSGGINFRWRVVESYFVASHRNCLSPSRSIRSDFVRVRSAEVPSFDEWFSHRYIIHTVPCSGCPLPIYTKCRAFSINLFSCRPALRWNNFRETIFGVSLRFFHIFFRCGFRGSDSHCSKMTPLNVSSEIIVLLESVLNEVP